MPRPNDPSGPNGTDVRSMSALEVALQVAVGGAVGTGVRLAVGGSLVLSASSPGPLRLLALNAIGSLLLGLLLAVGREGTLVRWTPLLATGLLGGMTTFSALIVQAGGLGHASGLVVAGTGRMTGQGLALTAGYLTLSVLTGLAAFVVGAGTGARRRAGRLARSAA